MNSEGIGWIGKHWILNNGEKRRIYTNCSALHHLIGVYRKSLIDFTNDDTAKPESLVDYPTTSDYLTLAIKSYKAKGALSWGLEKDTGGNDVANSSQQIVINYFLNLINRVWLITTLLQN